MGIYLTSWWKEIYHLIFGSMLCKFYENYESKLFLICCVWPEKNSKGKIFIICWWNKCSMMKIIKGGPGKLSDQEKSHRNMWFHFNAYYKSEKNPWKVEHRYYRSSKAVSLLTPLYFEKECFKLFTNCNHIDYWCRITTHNPQLNAI